MIIKKLTSHLQQVLIKTFLINKMSYNKLLIKKFLRFTIHLLNLRFFTNFYYSLRFPLPTYFPLLTFYFFSPISLTYVLSTPHLISHLLPIYFPLLILFPTNFKPSSPTNFKPSSPTLTYSKLKLLSLTKNKIT